MDLSSLIARLKAHEVDPCITITTPTASGDAIRLHRHVEEALGEAEQLLGQHYGPANVTAVLDRARQAMDALGEPDERPGLALFASADHAEALRLPFAVAERITVGSTFFTRDLLRNGLETVHHFVLLLAGDHARLLEGQDAILLGEHGAPFPVRLEADGTDRAAEGEEPEQRFHRRVDEAVRRTIGGDAVVVVHAPAALHLRFVEVARFPGIYVGGLEASEGQQSEADLVAMAAQVAYMHHKRRDLQELARMARSAPRITARPEDIWTEVKEGNPGVLFVERDHHQAALLENAHALLFAERTDHVPGVDLVDAIIEEQVEHGGEVRILPNGSLHEFGGMVWKPRHRDPA